MQIFASDLDNTLIYSYKSASKSDICVEYREGKQLSFMTPRAHGLLRRIVEEFTFVPVTTRSVAQYRRIDMLCGLTPKYALAANGGVLLIDNAADTDWWEQSKNDISSCLPALREGMQMMSGDECVYANPDLIDGLFVFARSHRPNETLKRLAGLSEESSLVTYSIGEKVYLFPKPLSKGAALRRLRQKLNPALIICAGDSVLDLPMLNECDIMLFANKHGGRKMDFSEIVLSIIRESYM